MYNLGKEGDENIMAMDWENYGRERYGRQPVQQSAAVRQQHRAHRDNTYVEGNTVRKLNAVPKRRVEPERRREPLRQPQRKPAQMPGISGRAFLFLMGALSLVMVIGFIYMVTQDRVRGLKSSITQMQQEIVQQREENEEEYQAITESVDLSEIYERATHKLKMVQAENNQVYTYSNKKSDMVKQYADIPKAGK